MLPVKLLKKLQTNYTVSKYVGDIMKAGFTDSYLISFPWSN
jgi:hypothetical protein